MATAAQITQINLLIGRLISASNTSRRAAGREHFEEMIQALLRARQKDVADAARQIERAQALVGR